MYKYNTIESLAGCKQFKELHEIAEPIRHWSNKGSNPAAQQRLLTSHTNNGAEAERI